jgi:ABC-2 type transport system permease protein
MDTRMNAGLDTFALNIPTGFQHDVLAGRAPALQLNIDATRMGQAFVGNGYIQSIITSEVEAFLQGHRVKSTPQIDLILRARFNPELNKAWFGGVMELINKITMLAIILVDSQVPVQHVSHV